MKQGLVFTFFVVFSQSFFASDDAGSDRGRPHVELEKFSSTSFSSDHSFGRRRISDINELIVSLERDIEMAKLSGGPIVPLLQVRYDSLVVEAKDLKKKFSDLTLDPKGPVIETKDGSSESSFDVLVHGPLQRVATALGARMILSPRGRVFSPIVCTALISKGLKPSEGLDMYDIAGSLVPVAPEHGGSDDDDFTGASYQDTLPRVPSNTPRAGCHDLTDGAATGDIAL